MKHPDIIQHFKGVKKTASGHKALCPAHNDTNPSLCITEAQDGRTLLKCHAGCKVDEICKAAGIKTADLFADNKQGKEVIAVYKYNGFEKLRYTNKDFKIKNPKGWGKGDIEPELYRQNEILDEPQVLIVEGEKDVENCRKLGIPATCNFDGAGKWRKQYNAIMRGKDVIIIEDNDEAGRKHAELVASNLTGIARRVRVLSFADKKEGYDISDFIADNPDNAGGAIADITLRLKTWLPESERFFSDGHTASELLQLQMKEPLWLIRDLIGEGLALLAGKPKLGKSWFVLGLSIAIASGKQALGTLDVDNKADVLCLFLEDSLRRVKQRLEKQLDGEPAPSNLHVHTQWPRLDQGGQERLELWLKKHPKTKLIVIDTLSRLRGDGSARRGAYDNDYRALEGLHRLAAEHGITILMVHHLRKAGAEDVVDQVSGTAGLTGAVDQLMILDRQRGNGKSDAELFISGRDIEENELALEFDIETCTWQLMGDAGEYRRSETRQKIVEILKQETDGLSPKDIAEALDMKGGTVRRQLAKMLDEGDLRKKDGLYIYE